jgi:hypothetical protein
MIKLRKSPFKQAGQHSIHFSKPNLVRKTSRLIPIRFSVSTMKGRGRSSLVYALELPSGPGEPRRSSLEVLIRSRLIIEIAFVTPAFC